MTEDVHFTVTRTYPTSGGDRRTVSASRVHDVQARDAIMGLLLDGHIVSDASGVGGRVVADRWGSSERLGTWTIVERRGWVEVRRRLMLIERSDGSVTNARV